MGHDIRVHTGFYRMPLNVIQIARVSKIFLAAEQGKIAQFAGKELADISVDPCEAVVEESSNTSESSDKEDICENESSAFDRPDSEQVLQPNPVKRSRTITNRKMPLDHTLLHTYLRRNFQAKVQLKNFLRKLWTKVKDHIRNTYLH